MRTLATVLVLGHVCLLAARAQRPEPNRGLVQGQRPTLKQIVQELKSKNRRRDPSLSLSPSFDGTRQFDVIGTGFLPLAPNERPGSGGAKQSRAGQSFAAPAAPPPSLDGVFRARQLLQPLDSELLPPPPLKASEILLGSSGRNKGKPPPSVTSTRKNSGLEPFSVEPFPDSFAGGPFDFPQMGTFDAAGEGRPESTKPQRKKKFGKKPMVVKGKKRDKMVVAKHRAKAALAALRPADKSPDRRPSLAQPPPPPFGLEIKPQGGARPLAAGKSSLKKKRPETGSMPFLPEAGINGPPRHSLPEPPQNPRKGLVPSQGLQSGFVPSFEGLPIRSDAPAAPAHLYNSDDEANYGHVHDILTEDSRPPPSSPALTPWSKAEIKPTSSPHLEDMPVKPPSWSSGSSASSLRPTEMRATTPHPALQALQNFVGDTNAEGQAGFGPATAITSDDDDGLRRRQETQVEVEEENDNMGFMKGVTFPDLAEFGFSWESQKLPRTARKKRAALKLGNPLYYKDKRRSSRSRNRRVSRQGYNGGRRGQNRRSQGPSGFWDDTDFDTEFFNGAPGGYSSTGGGSSGYSEEYGNLQLQSYNTGYTSQQSHEKYDYDRNYYTSHERNTYYDPIDNEILGSGNFDIVKGGTFYDPDTDYRYSAYSNGYGTSYNPVTQEQFHNFRDFADIKHGNRRAGEYY